MKDADTISRWRKEGGWEEVRALVDLEVSARMVRVAAAREGDLRVAHEGMIGALEALASRIIERHEQGDPTEEELLRLAKLMLTLQAFRQRATAQEVTVVPPQRTIIIETGVPPGADVADGPDGPLGPPTEDPAEGAPAAVAPETPPHPPAPPAQEV